MNPLQSVLILISTAQSASEVVSRAKRAAVSILFYYFFARKFTTKLQFEPFQPLVGASIAAAVNATEAVVSAKPFFFVLLLKIALLLEPNH